MKIILKGIIPILESVKQIKKIEIKKLDLSNNLAVDINSSKAIRGIKL